MMIIDDDDTMPLFDDDAIYWYSDAIFAFRFSFIDDCWYWLPCCRHYAAIIDAMLPLPCRHFIISIDYYWLAKCIYPVTLNVIFFADAFRHYADALMMLHIKHILLFMPLWLFWLLMLPLLALMPLISDYWWCQLSLPLPPCWLALPLFRCHIGCWWLIMMIRWAFDFRCMLLMLCLFSFLLSF